MKFLRFPLVATVFQNLGIFVHNRGHFRFLIQVVAGNHRCVFKSSVAVRFTAFPAIQSAELV
jgi:hypothetical protein